MPKVSIIVPVYNVEKYINRCIRSILNQSLDDFEIILVDDGSNDNCPQICEEWSMKDTRIKTIHQINGGLSSARNTGVDAARGEYIGFVDSDDWIEPMMYECLYNAAKENDVEIALCEMRVVKDERTDIVQPQKIQRVIDKNELMELFFRVKDNRIHYCVCDKLYKATVIKDIAFTEGIRFEDIDYNFKVFEKCQRAVYTNQVLYNWFFNSSGITRGRVVKNDLQLIDVWENIVQSCKQEFNQYEYYAQMNLERAYMGILGKALKFGVAQEYRTWRKDKCYLKAELRKYMVDLLKWNMPFSRKLLLLLLCI